MKSDINKLESIANEVVTYIELFFKKNKTVKVKVEDKHVPTVLIGLFHKAFNTYRAILVLIRNKQSVEAHILLRVLVETIVNISYILSGNLQELTRKYLAYQFILDKKLKDVLEKNPNLSDVAPYIKSFVKEHIEILEKIFDGKNIDEITKMGWKGLGRGEVKKLFGKTVPIAYDILYRVSSRHVHGNDIVDHIAIHPDGTHTMIVGNMSWASPCLRIGGLFLLASLEDMSKSIQLGNAEDYKRIELLYRKLDTEC